MDRLDELAVFAAIVETGSLAAAGRRLRRSPPAITRSLAALEQRLGARLVERTTRKAVPTEAGRSLADQAGRILAAYDDAMRVPGTAPHGLLRITAPVVFGRRHVTPVVTEFLDAHPAVRIDLVLADRNLDLIEEGFDVAVRIGTLAASAMVARRVGQVRRVLVASPGYLATHGTPAAPADLARHRIVYTASRPEPVAWHFRSGTRQQVVQLTPRLTINQVEAVLLAACAGYGVALALSYQVADELAAGTLVRLLQQWEPEPLPVQLVMPSAHYMPARVRAFLDHAVRHLSRLPVLRDG
jgi:DNA-binding transcriptional LysR family regulator